MQARLDRQQADARLLVLVVAQFGRTHRGPARRRRQNAPAVVGKENGVDQLALAARELGDERHLEAVALENVLNALDAVIRGGVIKVVLLQPRLEFGERLEDPGSPGAILFELMGEARHGVVRVRCFGSDLLVRTRTTRLAQGYPLTLGPRHETRAGSMPHWWEIRRFL
ncbi:hypothetical protein D3C81_1395520 [compost metagenome]